jgi:transcriptional regulator with XRE-family HTH domain
MTLPPDQCERLFSGVSPVLVWREFRGLAQTDLRRETGIRVEVLDKLERGVRKPTAAEARKLARALGVDRRDLEPHGSAFRGCAALDVDEDALLASYEGEAEHG